MARIPNKEELVDKIIAIEELTKEEKTALIGLLREKKRYGIVWEDKHENAELDMQDHIPTLKEVKDRAIISNSADAPNHIIIQGENLQALIPLTYTHEGKIDVIYIDPPYNTGNKDFFYHDSYVDKDDEYRHSKWLSFMSKRLTLAKQLLSGKGVIFISIDEHEQAQLNMLCNEVFGEENFIAKFDWRKKTGANDAKDIAVVTESVLLYAKSKSYCITEKIWARDESSIDTKRYKHEDEFVEERGRFYYDTLDRGGLQYSDSMNFGIEMPDGKLLYPNGRSEFANDGWIWKWGKDKVKWAIENKFVEFIKSTKNKHTSYTINYKVYSKVDNNGIARESQGRAYMNLILSPINQQGSSEMTEIFDGKAPFSNPKPIGLISYLLNTLKDKECVILDFFAGSGTTLHTTMLKNYSDGGKRQCILVTNNENGICENVTYERNKRVINGYTTPEGNNIEGLKDNNLRYYKVDMSVPRDATPQAMRQLMAASTDMLCIKNSMYDEQPTFCGKKLKAEYVRYFANEDCQMLIVYDERMIEYLVPLIEANEFASRLKVYVYSPSFDPFTQEWEEVADKVELCAMPQAILDVYRRLLKPKASVQIADEESVEPVNDEVQ